MSHRQIPNQSYHFLPITPYPLSTRTGQCGSDKASFPISLFHGRYILHTAEGARNHRKRSGHQGERHIASYNFRTLSEAKVLEMEEELNNIKWDIVGISEVKRREEDQITLKFGHKFHFII